MAHSASEFESPFSPQELREAVEAANVPTLLMILVHQTGDRIWLTPEFRAKASKGIEDPDEGGLPPETVRTIRDAAYVALSAYLAGEEPAIGIPEPQLAREMLTVAVGEVIPAEYGLMVSEELARILSPGPIQSAGKGTDNGSVDAIIIGAGVSGIAAAVRLRELGVPCTIFERNAGLGGVWLENRYPGAAVDTPNHLYSYSFAQGDWNRWFCEAPDIHNYLAWVAQKFTLEDDIQFDSSVVSARYDHHGSKWVVDVRKDDVVQQFESRILVSAVGAFNRPVIPPIPGRDSFQGPSFHSARWPTALELEGKRVAVLGNGASAMQIVPAIAPEVSELTVFQLEPHWVAPFPRFQQEVPAVVRKLFHVVPLYYAWYRMRLAWLFNDKLHGMLRRDPAWPHPERSMNAANDRFRQHLTNYIVSEVGDRADLLADVVPTYPPLGKRLLLDNGWYRTLTRENVRLVSESVAEVVPSGVVTRSNESIDVDVIIYATGFDVVSFLSTVNVVGKSGRALSDVWDGDNASAFLGLAVPDFPNLFILYGPNTQTGHGGSLIELVEAQLTHITNIVRSMQSKDLASVEVREEEYRRYVEQTDRAHAEMVWTHPGVETYYRNSRGRVVVNNAYRVVDFWHMTRHADLSSYESRQKDELSVPAG